MAASLRGHMHSVAMLFRAHRSNCLALSSALARASSPTLRLRPMPSKRIVTKGAGGSTISSVSAKPVKRKAADEPEEDSEVAARKAVAKQKAKPRRETIKHHKIATEGFDSLGQLAKDSDIEWIKDWCNSRPQIIGYLCSLLRNGLIEKSFNSSKGQSVPTVLGKRWVTGAAGKFRNLSASVSIAVLCALMPEKNIDEWFRGPAAERLDMNIAHKAMCFALCVTASTSLPKGHKHCGFQNPLLWLFKQRWHDLGQRLKDCKKETLDRDSDYFFIPATKQGVVFSLTKAKLKLPLEIKDDSCVLVDPSDYKDARLVSEELGLDLVLWRPFEKGGGKQPIFDEEFHFGEDAEMEGVFRGEGSQSSSAHDIEIDEALRVSPRKMLLAPGVGTPQSTKKVVDEAQGEELGALKDKENGEGDEKPQGE